MWCTDINIKFDYNNSKHGGSYNNSKHGGSVYYKEITACLLGGGDVIGVGNSDSDGKCMPRLVVDWRIVDVGVGREIVDMGAGRGTVDVGAGRGIVDVGVGGSQYCLHGQSLMMLQKHTPVERVKEKSKSSPKPLLGATLYQIVTEPCR